MKRRVDGKLAISCSTTRMSLRRNASVSLTRKVFTRQRDVSLTFDTVSLMSLKVRCASEQIDVTNARSETYRMMSDVERLKELCEFTLCTVCYLSIKPLCIRGATFALFFGHVSMTTVTTYGGVAKTV